MLVNESLFICAVVNDHFHSSIRAFVCAVTHLSTKYIALSVIFAVREIYAFTCVYVNQAVNSFTFCFDQQITNDCRMLCVVIGVSLQNRVFIFVF